MNIDKHGSPHDRGGADSYYRRPQLPHWWPHGTQRGTKIESMDMSPEEIADYNRGFSENEARGDFKDWGEYDDAESRN